MTHLALLLIAIYPFAMSQERYQTICGQVTNQSSSQKKAMCQKFSLQVDSQTPSQKETANASETPSTVIFDSSAKSRKKRAPKRKASYQQTTDLTFKPYTPGAYSTPQKEG